MSPAAATTTAFAAVSVAIPNPTAPSRGRVRLPLRGVPAAPRRVVASMAVSAPRSGVATSFLERRESERALHYQVSAPRSGAAAAASFVERRESERALHFVKYQGLGNDFIMVRPVSVSQLSSAIPPHRALLLTILRFLFADSCFDS